jgi:parallel beta-helix repeat protein
MTFAATSSSAATLLVSDGGTPCPGATYTTIQGAVDAAAPRDTIAVCRGTYAEQVTIPAGKDGIFLRSTEPLAAIIEAPAVMSDPGDIVQITAARDVTLEGFTVAGPLPNALFCSAFPRTGVRVAGGGSATLRFNHFTQIRSADPSLRGCQNGMAIVVGGRADGEVGSAFIVGNTIDEYQKDGVLVGNAGSSAIVLENLVIGDGPNGQIAQNGIEIGTGADGVVAWNRVSGQVYAPSPLASGLIFNAPGHIEATGNRVEKADYGIVALDVAGALISGNAVSTCRANGIDLDEVTTGTSGTALFGNDAYDNGIDGIFVSARSVGNHVRENRMRGNARLDAEDSSTGNGTAGTGNAWVENHCKTDNHGGHLCEP